MDFKWKWLFEFIWLNFWCAFHSWIPLNDYDVQRFWSFRIHHGPSSRLWLYNWVQDNYGILHSARLRCRIYWHPMICCKKIDHVSVCGNRGLCKWIPQNRRNLLKTIHEQYDLVTVQQTYFDDFCKYSDSVLLKGRMPFNIKFDELYFLILFWFLMLFLILILLFLLSFILNGCVCVPMIFTFCIWPTSIVSALALHLRCGKLWFLPQRHFVIPVCDTLILT